jgi:hypothetical protein
MTPDQAKAYLARYPALKSYLDGLESAGILKKFDFISNSQASTMEESLKNVIPIATLAGYKTGKPAKTP